MLSPLGWLNAAAAVAVREIQRLLRTPQEIIVCGFLPIFWVLVVWLLLGNGIVTQVPTGIVDNDHSQLSRDVISKIDATRSVGLVPFASHTIKAVKPSTKTSMRITLIFGALTSCF